MRVLALPAHSRPVTFCKYSSDGNYVFTCGKDKLVVVSRVSDGALIRKIDIGIGGANSIDFTPDCKIMICATSGSQVVVFDIENPTNPPPPQRINLSGVGRSIAFSEDYKKVVVSSDNFRSSSSSIVMFDFNKEGPDYLTGQRSANLVPGSDEVKCERLVWADLDTKIYGALDNGKLVIYNSSDLSIESIHDIHTLGVKDMSFNREKTFFLTCSTDQFCHLWDRKTLTKIKSYQSKAPINSCSFSPLMEHVLVGGGQDAGSVTTTTGSQGNFEANIFDMVTGKLLARVPGHFGPINFIEFRPDGTGYCSCGEEGYVRIHEFEDKYYTLGDPALDGPDLDEIINSGELEKLEEAEREAAANK